MANWRVNADATRQAQALFRGFKPEIRGNGRQYVLAPTPFGRVEFIPVRGDFLIAAELPPRTDRNLSREALSDEIARHLTTNGLQAWKMIPTQDVSQALSYLVRPGPTASHERAPEAVPWSPYLRSFGKQAGLIGLRREALAERLGSLVFAQGPGAPLPVLVGPAGVGKHVIAAAVATRDEMVPVELPLARLLVNRVLSTPAETFLETVIAAGSGLGTKDLLVVTDAELITRLTAYQRYQMLMELGRLPRVMLVATAGAAGWRCPSGLVRLACPGLANEQEGGRLLGEHFPGLEFVGSAMAMLCHASRLASVGIIPARLLFLARLGLERGDRAGAPKKFFPDDAATVVQTGAPAWKEEDVGRKQWGKCDE